jgi:hypothetical protein
MQTKVTMTLAMGFVLGLGLASCASVESSRTVASDSSPRYSSAAESKDKKAACELGEERSASGDCERPHDFDRPFRRGGR